MKVKILKAYWCKCGNSEHPHKYVKKAELHGKGTVKTHVYDIDGEYCCDEMDKALDMEFISLGDPEYTMTKDTTFSIVLVSWGNQLMSINFCPFCGEKIEYVDGGDYEEQ